MWAATTLQLLWSSFDRWSIRPYCSCGDWIWHCHYFSNLVQMLPKRWKVHFSLRILNQWYFVTKIVWTYSEKNLKLEAEGLEFVNIFRALFIQKWKVSTMFGNRITLLTAEIIKWQKCARMGLNGFHIKCIIGTHCNWKNQNPGSPLGATS